MKSDREFLDGIYEKARNMEIQEEPKRLMYRRFDFRPIMAIVCMLIITPIIMFSYNESTEIPKGYTMNNPVPRMISNEPEMDLIIDESDLIIQGKIVEIFRSKYGYGGLLYTKIKIKPIQALKGQVEDKYLTLRVKGGIDRKAKAYLEFEANFKEKEDTLLFLIQCDDGVYELRSGNISKFTYLAKTDEDSIYINSVGNKISINELKQKLFRGNEK